MFKQAPYWTILSQAEARWEAQLDNAGLIQIFLKNAGEEKGAFLFRQSADLEKKLSNLFSQISRDFSLLEVKLVVDKSLSTTAQVIVTKLGISLQKVVEREAPFELRYDPHTKKVLVTSATKEIKRALTENKTRVLIVDDSPTIRKLLEKILASDSELEVVGSVGLPSQVENAIINLKPDVITLDIHMPEMSGVDLLKQYLPKYSIPTVMISSISVEEGPLVLNALEAGAVDYIQKPSAQEMTKVSPLILLKVKMAARASLQKAPSVQTAERVHIDSRNVDYDKILAIGSSTGGTEALKEVFIRMPEKIPPIVVVQHIPAVFSKAFADRLNAICPFEVFEGVDGMEVQPNRVIIAPGGKHMRLKKRAEKLFVVIEETPPVNRHRPSVDVLFHSVAEICGDKAVGAILTGMGADGANGLLELKNKGCFTIGQDEKSCVVFGMPQAAMKLGATDRMVPLPEIAEVLMSAVSVSARKKHLVA